MTSRERFLASLTGGSCDRFFRYEHGPWPTTQERWRGEGYPPDAVFERYFDMDPLARISINSGYTNSPYHPKFEEQVLEETDAYKVFVDTDGVTQKMLKHHADTSMPQFLKFPVESRDDWRRILPRLNPDDAPARIGAIEHLARQCAAPDVPTLLPLCGAFGHPRNLLGAEGLCFALYDDPGLLEAMLDNWRDLYVALFRALTARVRVDALLIWEDMCFKNGPLIGPDHFRQFMLPRYRAVIETAHACGVRAIIVDTDGDCRSLLPLFLEAGADCLMPFEVQAGMDVTVLARQYPSLAIMGGIDKRALAESRPAIRAEVDRVLPHFVRRGRFVPTLDHTVPPNVPLDHFRYYLDCVRRYES